MDNIKYIKVCISALGSIIIAGLGGYDNLLKFLFVLIAADFVLGLLKALKTRTFDSRVTFWGGINKAVVLLVILIFNQCDITFNMSIFRNGAIIWFCICEGGSIIENLSALGLSLPEGSKEVISRIKKGVSVNFMEMLETLLNGSDKK